ncbi:MFS transporter [Nonomuraea sp. NPDC050536]|uniref:MFS transporter n=1 Tax=Nonomuraea sp. NPDC050536 TaxID=3364366 RepID=UPI0037C5568B
MPLAAYLSVTLGWQPAMIGVAALAALALLLVALLVPALPVAEPPTARAYRQALRTPGSLAAVLTTLLVLAAQFTVYGVAGTFLADRFGASAGAVSATLLVFGIVGVLANGLAARISGRLGAGRTVSLALGGLAVALVAVLVAPGTVAVAMAVFAVWGFFSSLVMAPQQARLVALLPDQPGLILAMNASALYLGMSLGSLLGGTLLPLLGAAVLPVPALVLLAVAAFAHRSSKRVENPRAVPTQG